MTRVKNDALIVDAIGQGWFDRKVMSNLHIDDPDGCWTWKRSCSSGGYGQVALPREVTGGKLVLVRSHRAVWIALRGQIPDGMVIDHGGANGCHNRACANPDHLEITDLSGNARTAQRIAITHCPNGHLLEGDNLMPSQIARGHRQCLPCNRQASRDRVALVRQARILMGMSTREYAASFGTSRHTALHVLGGTAQVEVAS